MTFAYLPISRFAVARSSSLASAGSGNSATSLIGVCDDTFRLDRRGRIELQMAYVIVEPCINVKDASCVDVCPVDCIYTTDADNMYFIHPDECIDCGACESVCPVSAIFPEDAVPDKWKNYIEINKNYFNK
jgi:NAD-dependent dihydropyrimidine dehydrogenase PreA subunit